MCHDGCYVIALLYGLPFADLRCRLYTSKWSACGLVGRDFICEDHRDHQPLRLVIFSLQPQLPRDRRKSETCKKPDKVRKTARQRGLSHIALVPVYPLPPLQNTSDLHDLTSIFIKSRDYSVTSFRTFQNGLWLKLGVAASSLQPYETSRADFSLPLYRGCSLRIRFQ